MSRAARSIPPLGATPEWRAASGPGEREAAAITWVRQGQAETGTEHAAVLTCDGGLVYAGSSGLGDKVRIPPTGDAADVVLHHSHPGEDSLSPADLCVAWARSRGSEVRAYTPGGSVFCGRSLSNPELWRAAREAARAAIASELRVLGRRDGRSYSYLAAHLVNADMERIGLLWYKARLGIDSRRDLARLASDLRACRAVIRREFEGDG